MNINKYFEKSAWHSIIWPIWHSIFHRSDLKTINKFVLFVGNSRSGTTLISAILDAHPSIVISHELSILKYVKSKLSRWFLYSKVIAKSKLFAKKGSQWQSFKYIIPDSFQGAYDQLQIIGDKKAHQTVRLLLQKPDLLTQFQQKINLPILFLHVIRNPFDTIATKSRRGSRHKVQPTLQQLKRETQIYFENIQYIEDLERKGNVVVNIYFEHFINQPDSQIAKILDLLGVSYQQNLIDQSKKIITQRTTSSRQEISWEKEVLDEINLKIQHHPILRGYTFDD